MDLTSDVQTAGGEAQQQCMASPATAGNDQQLISAESERALEKKQQKAQKRMAIEFVQAMSGSIQSLESNMQHGTTAQKELAKQRRKAIKEVLKAVTDSSRSVDDRLRLLQTKFVQMVQEQAKQDRETLALKAERDAAVKESEQGQADLARTMHKVDTLQQLARTLQKENKILSEEVDVRTEQVANFASTTESIKAEIESHGSESMKVLKENKALLEENAGLRQKLGEMGDVLSDSQVKLEALRSTQAEQLADIQAKLGQQSDFIEKSQELQQHMNTILEENKVLHTKLQAVQLTNKHLEALNAEYKVQLENNMTRVKEFETALTASTNLRKMTEKLHLQMDEQRKLIPQLMQERQLLKQEVSQLQKQVKDQGDDLWRSQLQKQRLEGLCRALQARADTVPAGADDGAAGMQELPAAEAADAEVAQACSQVVQAAIAAVVAQNAG